VAPAQPDQRLIGALQSTPGGEGMDLGIEGKVAIVTGGTSGIGLEIARSFAGEGARVVINGRDRSKLDAALASLGPRASGVVADLTTQDGADRLAAFAEAVGPVEFLVNNIGRFDVEDFFDISDERWHDYFDTNVLTGVRITRLVMRSMLERDTGSIVFIASEAALRSLPHMTHYSVTKTAQLGLSRALAERTRGTGVRVNAYMPGPTATDSVTAFFEALAAERGRPVDEVLAEFFKVDMPGSLLQRLIDPAMHGRAVVQLATNSAQNGTAQRGDGGAFHSIV
jgi:NAD(P)-dependent dehydrogenase (short-subunit alcohol dehydrogenase family)